MFRPARSRSAIGLGVLGLPGVLGLGLLGLGLLGQGLLVGLLGLVWWPTIAAMLKNGHNF